MTGEDWIKIGAGFISGGFLGALYTNWRTDRRNKIQPVGRKISVSYINLPKLLPGFDPIIALKSADTANPSMPYHFEQLAIIQLELKNIGNRDIPKFDLGINIPEENQIIGIQENSDDRYHKISYKPDVTITSPSAQLDCEIEPFNRKDKYHVTLLVSAKDKGLNDNIKLSKTLPIRFVDLDAKEKAINLSGFLLAISVMVIAGLLLAKYTNQNELRDLLFTIVAIASTTAAIEIIFRRIFK